MKSLGQTRVFAPGAVALGWLMGTWLGLGAAQALDGAVVWLALAPGLVLLTVWRRPVVSALGALGLLACALVAGWGGVHAQAQWRLAHALAPTLEGVTLNVVGRVADLPRWGPEAVRFAFAVDAASRVDDQVVTLPPRIDLSWYRGLRLEGDGTDGARADLQRGPQALWPGQRLALQVRLKAPHGGVNPGGFDFELWAWSRGVQAVGYVRAGPADVPPRWLDDAGGYPVQRLRAQVRSRIWATVDEPTRAALLSALVLGDQAGLDRAQWDVFRATGVAHLMSISGLHVTLLAWLLTAVVQALWRHWAWACARWPARRVGLLVGLLAAWAYALFAGWGVPAQRTVLMLAVGVALQWRVARWPWPHRWLIVALIVTAWDPWAMLEPGFWLSFVAVGVLFAMQSEASNADGTRVRGYFQSLLREQAMVTLTLTPLTLVAFGQVSLLALPANLLAIPWVTLVVTPLALLGVVFAPAWGLAGAGLDGLAVLLQAGAQWPWAVWWAAQAPTGVGLLAVAAGALAAVRLPWPVRAAAVLCWVPLLLWRSPGPPAGQVSVLAADIGQGNAVLVRTAHHALVFDAGPRYSEESDAGQRVLVPLLRTLGVRPDALVLSHRDSDHTGGASAVWALNPTQQVWLGQALTAAVLPDPARRAPCLAGQGWVWDNVRFDFLHPQRAPDALPSGRPNARSCVLRVQAANGATVLLTADIEAEQELDLVARWGPALRADVLLVPHHGSKTSSSAALLQAVQPRAAWVQAGYRNRFGHPASPVLVRYAQANIPVWRTDQGGALFWQSDAPDLVQAQRHLEPRIWRHQSLF